MRKLGYKVDIMHDKRRFFWLIALVLSLSTHITHAQSAKNDTWYRYKNAQGTATLSRHVSEQHIRHGYEVLDAHGQVIKRVAAFQPERADQQAQRHNAQHDQREHDLRLQQAYGSSQMAMRKRDETLKHLKQQISSQQLQLHQLQQEQQRLNQQAQRHVQGGQKIPLNLQNTLIKNQKNIQNSVTQLQSLNTQYQKNQAEYQQIISRLKRLE